MRVNGDFYGSKNDLDDTITEVSNLARELESYCDVGCLFKAIDYLYEIADNIS